jgi:hypothetical protein
VRSCFWSLVTIWCTIRSMVSSASAAGRQDEHRDGGQADFAGRERAALAVAHADHVAVVGVVDAGDRTSTPFSAMLADFEHDRVPIFQGADRLVRCQ